MARRAGAYRDRRQRGKKKSNDKPLAFWLLGGSGVVIVSILAALIFVKPADINPLTGCPRGDAAPKAHTVILIDETDRLSRSELKFTSDLVMTEYRWLPLGGELTVRSILADPAEGEDITICRIADSSSTGGLIDNERAIRERFERIAGSRLDALFESLATAPIQTKSPIMETMTEVFDRSDFAPNVPLRRFVVISDFVQHSSLFSMYSGQWRRALPKSVSEELTRDLSGIDVRLQYVRRSSLARLQGAKHREFWRRYIEDQGAKSVAVDHGLLIGESPDRPTWLYSRQKIGDPSGQGS